MFRFTVKWKYKYTFWELIMEITLRCMILCSRLNTQAVRCDERVRRARRWLTQNVACERLDGRGAACLR